MTLDKQRREARKRADAHKERLWRQFRRELAGGLERSLPVVAALAEVLVEAATAQFGPAMATELFRHMIDEVERDPTHPNVM
jgi:hypothetical protein